MRRGDDLGSDSLAGVRDSSKAQLMALSAVDCPKVPLPPALPLLLSGFIGLAGFARLRRTPER